MTLEPAPAMVERARFHKRQAAHHRRAARAWLERLRAFCDEHGVDFSEMTEGDNSHGQQPARATVRPRDPRA